jgi:chromate transporter
MASIVMRRLQDKGKLCTDGDKHDIFQCSAWIGMLRCAGAADEGWRYGGIADVWIFDREFRKCGIRSATQDMMTKDAAPKADTEPSRKVVSPWDLFSGFLLVGMFGFGGIATALFHVVVERKRWLTPEEYASTLSLGQVLPGANLINLTTMVGDRFQGVIGALLALGGLMSMPLISLIALTTLYDRFSNLPDVHAAMLAAAAGAVGLTIGTGVKLARTILKSPVAICFAAVSFAAIGLLRFPILQTILVLAPLAVATEFWSQRR